MIIDVVTKQPIERLDWDLDCSPAFNDDNTDSVTQAELTVSPTGELVATAVILNSDTVKIWLEDGEDCTDYQIEIKITTQAGRIKEDELLVQILEV